MLDVRKFAKHDKSFLEFLHWLENLKAELTPQLLLHKAMEKPGWNVPDLNRQLYGVLSECAIGAMKGKVMAYEKEVSINGAKFSEIWRRRIWTAPMQAWRRSVSESRSLRGRPWRTSRSDSSSGTRTASDTKQCPRTVCESP